MPSRRPDIVETVEIDFNQSERASLGVEMEFALVDRETGALVLAVFGEGHPDGVHRKGGPSYRYGDTRRGLVDSESVVERIDDYDSRFRHPRRATRPLRKHSSMEAGGPIHE